MQMKISIIIFAILLPICISSFVNINRTLTKRASKRASKNKFIIYIPEVYAVVGFLVAFVFSAFILFSPLLWPNENGKSLIVFYISFGAFVLLGIYIIIKSLRFRIVVDKGVLTVYPLFQKSYSFTFDEVEIVTRQTKKRYEGYAERLVVRTKDGKKTIIESSFVNYKKMVEQIIENVDRSKLQWDDGSIRGRFNQSGDGSAIEG